MLSVKLVRKPAILKISSPNLLGTGKLQQRSWDLGVQLLAWIRANGRDEILMTGLLAQLLRAVAH